MINIMGCLKLSYSIVMLLFIYFLVSNITDKKTHPLQPSLPVFPLSRTALWKSYLHFLSPLLP